ncbi:hypothetical protein [Amycolatopsis sp. CA-230715]|uniref:hypothetical protein n=1 Tax=Amycolatopsis sp. CA-230715 TaxID=2745196 RepID=UPI001C00AEA3|nr:hypothetical protein [Amycolatopsis sp. CA-230715]QWF78693.1 hypothetical protein HUW46_02091 [Amycolatopsis sp. CA-230715]
MHLAAEPPPSTGPPWLVITLACSAGLATLITAVMPLITEKIKHRASKPSEPASPAPPPPVERADRALDLVELAMTDLRVQLTACQRETVRLRRLLDRRDRPPSTRDRGFA